METRPLDLDKLRHFLAVYEHHHFGRAAAAMRVTQPAVTRSVRALEEELGVSLFERGRFGARTTIHGETLASRVRLAFAELHQARIELESVRGSSAGRVMIGVGITMASRLFPLAVSLFRRRWPEVTLAAEVGASAELLPRLVAGELEIVVSAPPSGLTIDEMIGAEPLYQEWDLIACACTHPLAGRNKVPLHELASYPWMVHTRGGLWTQVCRQFLNMKIAPPRCAVETSDTTLAKALAAEGSYLIPLSHEQLASDNGQRNLIVLDTDLCLEPRIASIFWRKKTHLSLPARNLAEQLKTAAARLAQS